MKRNRVVLVFRTSYFLARESNCMIFSSADSHSSREHSAERILKMPEVKLELWSLKKIPYHMHDMKISLAELPPICRSTSWTVTLLGRETKLKIPQGVGKMIFSAISTSSSRGQIATSVVESHNTCTARIHQCTVHRPVMLDGPRPMLHGNVQGDGEI